MQFFQVSSSCWCTSSIQSSCRYTYIPHRLHHCATKERQIFFFFFGKKGRHTGRQTPHNGCVMLPVDVEIQRPEILEESIFVRPVRCTHSPESKLALFALWTRKHRSKSHTVTDTVQNLQITSVQWTGQSARSQENERVRSYHGCTPWTQWLWCLFFFGGGQCSSWCVTGWDDLWPWRINERRNSSLGVCLTKHAKNVSWAAWSRHLTTLHTLLSPVGTFCLLYSSKSFKAGPETSLLKTSLIFQSNWLCSWS